VSLLHSAGHFTSSRHAAPAAGSGTSC